MQGVVDIALAPAEAVDPVLVRQAAAEEAGIPAGQVIGHRIVKRSVDARSHSPRIRLRVEFSTEMDLEQASSGPPVFSDTTKAPTVIIVGCGPAGLFAAMRCIERGLRPVLLERGKDVRARRRDLAVLNRDHIVDPDSNYCFGEGGAGTFSDGKLYTRSHKRGDVAGVLERLVAFGAPPDIRVDAHPHIGTNKLPGIIVAMREAIVAAGGEVRFNARVSDLVLKDGHIRGVVVHDTEEIAADRVILATGHSARDIFRLLQAKGVRMERKDLALGVRVEHPQQVIDRIQYHSAVRDPHLPPASYAAVQQVQGLGVYSFCMCPGGIIAPCATEQDEVVTNGWSPSKRNNPYANSGIVVEQRGPVRGDPLAGMHFQKSLEHAAWKAGGERQSAPAQRLDDFIMGRPSQDLPDCSYPPGIVPFDVGDLLPSELTERLRRGLLEFGRKMRGYRTNEAVVVAVESRTSSPVRIPRDPSTLEHVEVKGLFPCGEGAGYAGGIVSAAMDGQRVADRVADLYPAAGGASA